MIRRKNTKELPGESIRDLAQINPADKIIVNDNDDNCGMAHLTLFLYHKTAERA